MRREKKDVTTETDTWVYYGRIPNYYGRQQQQAIYHPYLRVLGFIHNNRTQYGRQEAHVLLVQDTRENGRVSWTHTQKKAIFHRGPREAVQVPDATGGTFDTGRPEQLDRWDRNVVNTRPHGKRLSRTVIIFSCFSRRRPCTRSNACTTTGFGQSEGSRWRISERYSNMAPPSTDTEFFLHVRVPFIQYLTRLNTILVTIRKSISYKYS